ncbi:MAG TPA: LytTR family DNA-binding domain-containing protein [Saprospiraceae bacterium]|nr:LytTR family DNA-binding domain-containing protein [Saprospiraceae bacterium]HMQ84462.1 LytTR family DNA-binding domain-containing protein [Saprospiraceae bacterium]
MIRCIIVEDEEMSRVNLSRLCQLIDDLQVVASFDNALDALQFLRREKVDLIFLDIEMPHLNGIEFIKSRSDLPAIVFTTGNMNYAAQAFDFIEQVVDYLIKPITLPRLLKSMERYHHRGGSRLEQNPPAPLATQEIYNEAIFLKTTDKRLVRIALNDLLYIETTGDYTLFKTKDQQYLAHTSLKSIESRLSHPSFLKVHRSYIVNLQQIVDIEEGSLLIGKKVIPVSRAHRATLLEHLALF